MEQKVPVSHTCPRSFDLGVAEVLANWQNVFRAINLATGIHTPFNFKCNVPVKLGSLADNESDRKLPEMLVRIPVNNDPKPGNLDN